MTWEEALKLTVERTRNPRYTELTADANPDTTQRDGYRSLVVRIATGTPDPSPPVPEPATDFPPVVESRRQQQEEGYPSAATMVGNALGAAARFVASGMQTVAPEEFERRHAICEACDQFVAEEDRCRACGCYLAIKPWGARESCPIRKW